MSVGVMTPGAKGSPQSRAAAIVEGLQPGATPNSAPTSIAASTCARFSRVPAPARISGTSARMRRIASAARAVRNVSSIAPTPPASNARAIGPASSGFSTVTTATTPERAKRSASGSGNIDVVVMASKESEPRRDHQLTCDQTVVGVEHRQR